MALIKVRARAVDLLGRQQIMGIPSAVHELFKNAYDAFAQRVEVDFFRTHNLLMLRDDGFGMTRDEFENRWLTIGTESKVGKAVDQAPWMGEFGETPRRILGEKGIGRLAIAAIGPMVLVVSRAKRPNPDGLGTSLHDAVACLLPWRLFEVPGISLDRINIPVRTLNGGEYPNKTVIGEMADEIEANLEELAEAIPADIAEDIRQQLVWMHKLSPGILVNEFGGPSLEEDGCGTHFFIHPVDEVLKADMDDADEQQASRLEKLLLGFSNTAFGEENEPPIIAAFRDHLPDGRVRDLIGFKEFFTPDEFRSADHQIEGAFDAYGQFTGSVRVYNHAPVSYTLNWNKGSSGETLCGPFDIKIGYLQGLSHESLLDTDEYARVSQKLNRIGGLYIYRDGIRILPYGDPGFDFLGIETRRNLAAKDWFFSYRRLFGAALISSQFNEQLSEKAGREGFRENIAYRQFKDILQNLFKCLARDFFTKEANIDGTWERMKEELQAQNETLKKREKQKRERQKAFGDALDGFFDKVQRGEPGERVEQMRSDFGDRFAAIQAQLDPNIASDALFSLDEDFRESIASIRNNYRVSRPQGMGLSKKRMAEWMAYQSTAAELDSKLFGPVEQDFNKLVGLEMAKGAAIRRRATLRRNLDSMHDTAIKVVKSESKGASDTLAEVGHAVGAGIKDSLARVRQNMESVFSDFERTDTAVMAETQFAVFRSQLDERISHVAETEGTYLKKLREQLDTFTEAVKEGVLPDDITSALEDQNESLREELENNLQWAQVGMALGIVQHEFHSTVNSVKKTISALAPWAKGTPQLKPLVSELRHGFEHLESYLQLFAPLERRLRRTTALLSGKEIAEYLQRIFEERFLRHEIKLLATSEFRAKVVEVFPSALLPVFINVVDNASYWLKTLPKDVSREIQLNVDNEGFLIGNNGPGVDLRDAERIFEFGYTTKADGRGMGLYVSRQVLRREAMDLSLINPGKLEKPVFKISFPAVKAEEEEA